MVKLQRITNKKLGQILLEEGVLSREDINRILEEQKVCDEKFGEILIRLDYASEEDMAMCMVSQFNLPYIDVSFYKIEEDLVKKFSKTSMLDNYFIPLSRLGNVMTIAIAGPVSEDVLTEVETVAGSEIKIFISTFSRITEAVEQVFS